MRDCMASKTKELSDYFTKKLKPAKTKTSERLS
jgi:hypothetical protein